ncbi:MAG: hypothetical protein J3R72DRAFT_489062 [Linnemannia gamsii]|nr:MAG: hypothetical protein J3R72DRAFT_489062 [Linnemannia gamsii]
MINGGRVPVDQFIALDLTVSSWSTSSPPWMVLTYSAGKPPVSKWHSMVVSMDHASLFLWDPYNTGWSTFSIADRTWTNTSLPIDATREIAVRSAVDYNTGDIYIPAGSSNGTQMTMKSLTSTAYTTSAMPTDTMPHPINHETWVWSSVRRTFLHYGGNTRIGKFSNPYLNEYSPTKGWSRVTTTGPSPGDLSGHCMVPAYGGKKMILFGGTSVHEDSSSAIYILDVETGAWTAGKTANVNQARCNMACAVAGDSFVAWGGDNKRFNVDATPIVYNLVNNEWTTQFYLVSPVGQPPAPPPPPGTNPNYAAIGGGVAGVIVLAGLVALFFIKRRKRRNDNKSRQGLGHECHETPKPSEDPVTPFTGASERPGHEPISKALSLSQYKQHQQQQHQQDYQDYQDYDHHHQYQYQPEPQPRPMSAHDSRPSSAYYSQHQLSSYPNSNSNFPEFAPFTPTHHPSPLQPQPIQPQDYIPLSPFESVATIAKFAQDDRESQYSPTNTFDPSRRSSGYSRNVSLTASEFSQPQFKTSGNPQTYAPAPGNPQFIPPPTFTSSSTTTR